MVGDVTAHSGAPPTICPKARIKRDEVVSGREVVRAAQGNCGHRAHGQARRPLTLTRPPRPSLRYLRRTKLRVPSHSSAVHTGCPLGELVSRSRSLTWDSTTPAFLEDASGARRRLRQPHRFLHGATQSSPWEVQARSDTVASPSALRVW